MKRVFFGIFIFICIAAFGLVLGELELAVNMSGIIGIGGMLTAGFLETGFISPSSPVLGNLAIIKLDEKMNLSNSVFLLSLPSLIGAVLLYLLF